MSLVQNKSSFTVIGIIVVLLIIVPPLVYGLVLLVIKILTFYCLPSRSPFLIKGMVNAEKPLVISVNPKHEKSIPVYRSDNQIKGIEFTWSVWINITDLQLGLGKYKHIFHKGETKFQGDGMNFPINAPGLYIAPNENKLVVRMNTFSEITEEITVPNIPINKWVLVMIRVEGTDLDVYINGTITKRHHLNSVVMQNYGDVSVAMNGGFNGYISSLRYFDYALQPGEIQHITKKGPNLKMEKNDSLDAVPPYLSLKWYFYGM